RPVPGWLDLVEVIETGNDFRNHMSKKYQANPQRDPFQADAYHKFAFAWRRGGRGLLAPEQGEAIKAKECSQQPAQSAFCISTTLHDIGSTRGKEKQLDQEPCIK